MRTRVVVLSILIMSLCNSCYNSLSQANYNVKTLDNFRELKSLDGTWQIIFDPENVGRDADWHLDKVFSAQSTIREIMCPVPGN